MLIYGVTERVGKTRIWARGSYESSNSTPVDKAYTDAMDADLELAVSFIADQKDEMTKLGSRIQNNGVNQSATLLFQQLKRN